jgi:ribosomal protein S18 acetylase RimI-like enzyme
MTVTVELEHLTGEYSVSRLSVNHRLPDWVTGPGLVNVTYAEDEISVVCPSDRVPAQTETSPGWSAIKVSTKFEFDEAGVVLSVVKPISSAGLGVFVVSTFYRDYLLVRTNELGKVRQLLLAEGHQFRANENAITIRPATSADTDAVAHLHVQVWRETYRGIAPKQAIAVLDEDYRRPSWQKSLGAPEPNQKTLIALRENAVIGFVSFGPVSGDTGEVKHLYVDPRCKRTGVGSRLLTQALRTLSEAGLNKATLAVVQENEPAQAFYRAQGGRDIGHSTDTGPLWKSDNRIFEWTLVMPTNVTESTDG